MEKKQILFGAILIAGVVAYAMWKNNDDKKKEELANALEESEREAKTLMMGEPTMKKGKPIPKSIIDKNKSNSMDLAQMYGSQMLSDVV